MNTLKPQGHLHKLSAAGVLITLGIVFGDIGTSPLYVLSAIVGPRQITAELVLGGLSCIFWTLTFQTTFKYVLLTLRADNKGEGGIFSLYALVRRRAKWLVIPAIIGGASLLADGIITPPISVSSAIEGLLILNPNIPVISIVVVILLLIFVFQQLGTKAVGNFFGPMMMIWFGMLAVLGGTHVFDSLAVFKAISPYYAIDFLAYYPGAFWLLGAVFLCTTGAEALYSDLGHCGRQNIQVSWMFVKICLLLNYFGQGAWLLSREGTYLNGVNPFYALMPHWFLFPGIAIATGAAIIASQALISGSYTLISEAIRLNLWPKVKIAYPTIQRGQVYIGSINWLLCIGCVAIMLFFKRAAAMEAAYGLAITITMLMTTILLTFYLRVKKWSRSLVLLLATIFLSVELSFLFANLNKFPHGGYVTILVSTSIMAVMWIWFKARKIKNRYVEFIRVDKFLPRLNELSEDETITKYATHLCYLTSANYSFEIESKIVYSIFNKQPKRADMYWFLHVDVLDDPHTMEYRVEVLVPGKVVRVEFRLGFRVPPKINLYFRKVVEEMSNENEVDIFSRYATLRKENVVGDFRFVVIERVLTYDYKMTAYENFLMGSYYNLKQLSLSEEKGFGLDTSSVVTEKVPLGNPPIEELALRRVK